MLSQKVLLIVKSKRMRSLTALLIQPFTDFLEIIPNLTYDDKFKSYSFFIGFLKKVSLNSI
jgi:hypothetical protein